MGTAQRVNEAEESSGMLWNAVETLRTSALLTLALVGAMEIVAGYLLEMAIQSGMVDREMGVWAAILAVWGTGLIVVGVTGYALIWFKRR